VTDANTGEVIGGKHFDNLSDTNSIKEWQKSLFKSQKTSTRTRTAKGPTWTDFETAQAKSNILIDQQLAAGKVFRDMPSVYEMMLPEIKKQILDPKSFDLKKVLKEYVSVGSTMLMVGGGSKSRIWRQIFADAYGRNIITSHVAQDAGSFGAAAVAAVGVGLWENFDRVKELTRPETKTAAISEHAAQYEKRLPIYQKILDDLSEIGDLLQTIE
jgi:sugar (pentulose or hexulose) kinase